MAAGGGGGGEHQRPHSKGRQRLLFVVEEDRIRDRGCYQYLVFKINLKDMFVASAAGEENEDDWVAAMRSFPRPATQIDTQQRRLERLDLAVVSGATIVAVSCDKRTVIYDTAAAAEVPCGRELRSRMSGGATLIPLGTQLYAVGNHLLALPRAGDSVPSFQALQPPAPASGRGRWSWRALPAPPRDLYKRLPFPAMPFCSVTAVLAAGNRVWVSASDRGTYSFDTARLVWRKEGDWQLPFEHHGLFVPDLGLCFAICPHRLCLIAFDAPTTTAGTGAGKPPAIRYVWEDETFPRECHDRGFFVRTPRGLAYLGDGRFCIAWTIGIEYAEEQMMRVPSQFAVLLVAFQLVRGSPHRQESGELRLVKHKTRCYKMSSHGVDGYVLQPSLD